jgi:hypothetical protein
MQIPAPACAERAVYSYYDNANPRQTARGFTFNIFLSLALYVVCATLKICVALRMINFRIGEKGLYLAPFAVSA